MERCRSGKELMEGEREGTTGKDNWAEKEGTSHHGAGQLETGEGHRTMANGVAAQRSQ